MSYVLFGLFYKAMDLFMQPVFLLINDFFHKIEIVGILYKRSGLQIYTFVNKILDWWQIKKSLLKSGISTLRSANIK